MKVQGSPYISTNNTDNMANINWRALQRLEKQRGNDVQPVEATRGKQKVKKNTNKKGINQLV